MQTRDRITLPFVFLAAACAAETGGPTPTVESVAPEVICTAQQDVTLTLTGSGFSPGPGAWSLRTWWP